MRLLGAVSDIAAATSVNRHPYISKSGSTCIENLNRSVQLGLSCLARAAERAIDQLNYQLLGSKPMRIMWSHRDPSARRSGVGNIFIKNLSKTIDNKALHDTFNVFGNILSCKVAADMTAGSKGYGFVHFEDDKSAQTAIEKVRVTRTQCMPCQPDDLIMQPCIDMHASIAQCNS